jgi:hypothetical protein
VNSLQTHPQPSQMRSRMAACYSFRLVFQIARCHPVPSCTNSQCFLIFQGSTTTSNRDYRPSESRKTNCQWTGLPCFMGAIFQIHMLVAYQCYDNGKAQQSTSQSKDQLPFHINTINHPLSAFIRNRDWKFERLQSITPRLSTLHVRHHSSRH